MQTKVQYKIKIKDLVRFEIKSWLGRNILKLDKPKLNYENNYLNLGCGSNIVKDYINADFFNYSLKPWCNFNKMQKVIEWQLDLRYPLNCPSNIFDGIYTEHTLEHLYPDDAINLIKELYRILKHNCFVRITVPDIEKYVKFYIGQHSTIEVNEFKKLYNTGCSAIQNITQNYKHISVWDYNELKLVLQKAGFRDVKKKEYGVTQDEKLNLDLKQRAWESLYVEARK